MSLKLNYNKHTKVFNDSLHLLVVKPKPKLILVFVITFLIFIWHVLFIRSWVSILALFISSSNLGILHIISVTRQLKTLKNSFSISQDFHTITPVDNNIYVEDITEIEFGSLLIWFRRSLLIWFITCSLSCTVIGKKTLNLYKTVRYSHFKRKSLTCSVSKISHYI